MQNNSQFEVHLIRLTITIRKVLISVRFPCSLTFTLKPQKQSDSPIDNKHSYQLKKGQAIVNQSISLQTQVQYDKIKRVYLEKDKKVSLIVNMTSANGKIPAGSVQISITNDDINKATEVGEMSARQKSVVLQRCPDKNAKITFLQTVQFIKKIQGSTFTTNSSTNIRKIAPNIGNTGTYSGRQHMKTQDSYSVSSLKGQKVDRVGSVSGVSGGKARNFKGSMVSTLGMRQYNKNQYENSGQKDEQQIEPTYGMNNMLNNARSMQKQIASSRVKTSNYNNGVNSGYGGLPPKYSQRTRVLQRERSQVFEGRNLYNNSQGQRSGRLAQRQRQRQRSTFQRDGTSQSRVSGVSSKMSELMLQNQQQELDQQKKKIMKLQRERAQHIKELAKLRGEVQTFQMQNESGQMMEEEIYKLRDQNEQLYIKIDKLQQKNRQFEFKQKQLQNKVREIKQQLQEKAGSAKKNQLQKNQIQNEISSKDKTIRQLQLKVKNMQSKIEDLTVENSTQQKRIEFKENAYKEQLKKISQKYNQSENQRQKASFDLNNMLMDFESNEKKNQNLMKEKQRMYSQEKAKLNKKVENLSKQLTQVHQQMNEKEAQIMELSKKLKKYQSVQNQSYAECQRLSRQLELATNSLKKQIEQRKNLYQQVELLKSADEQRAKMSKKLNDAIQQVSLYKIKLQTSENLRKQFQQKSLQLEHNLKAISNEKIQKERLANKLLKQADSLKRQEQKRMQEAQTLSLNNYNATQKAQDLRMKLDAQILKYETLQNEYTEEVTYYIKIKEQMESQMQDLKWAVDQQKQKQQQFMLQIRTVNQEKLKIHHENLELAENYRKLGDQIRDIKTIYHAEREKAQKLQIIQRQLNGKVKQRNERIKELQVQLCNKDHSLSNAKDRLIQYEILLAEKQGRQRQMQKDESELITKKNEQYSLLERQIHKKGDKIAILERQLKNKDFQLQNLQEQIKAIMISVREYEQSSVQSEERLQKLNERNNKLKYDYDLSQQEVNNQRKNFQKLKRQWQEYNKNVYKNMEQLLNEISKDQVQSSSATRNLYVFEDTALSILQVQILKKRNSLILNYRQKIAQKQQSLKFYEGQLSKLKRYSSDRQKQFQLQQKRWKQQLNGYLQQIKGQKTDLFERLQDSENQLTQMTINNQRLKGQIEGLRETLQQKQFQVEQLIKQNDSLYDQGKAAEESLQRHKAQTLKQRKLSEEKYASMKENLEQELIKQRAMITEQEKRSQSLEKTVLEKQQTIQRMRKQLISYQLKLEGIYHEHNNKTSLLNDLASSKLTYEREQQSLKRQIKRLAQAFDKKQIQCDQSQNKNEQISRKIENLNEQITKITIESEKLRTQNHQYCQNIKEFQDEIRQLRQRIQKGKSLSTQRQNTQNKQLNERVIEMSSKLQIAEFINKQNENTIQELTSDNESLQNQLQKKKQEYQKCISDYYEIQKQLIQKSQGQQFFRKQNLAIIEELESYKEKVQQMQFYLIQFERMKQQISMQERQLTKLREQRQNAQKHYEKSVNELRTSMVGTRRQMVARNTKEQQQRIRIRQLQRLLEQRQMDLATEKKKWQAEAEKQRKQIEEELQLLQKANVQLQQQYDAQRQQLNNQIDALTHQCINLQGVIAEKQELLRAQDSQIQQYEKKIDDLTQQLKNCLQVWDKQKTTYLTSKKQMGQIQNEMNKFQRYAIELDTRSKQLIEVSKARIKQGTHPNVNDMLREVSMALTKMKTRSLGKTANETQKVNIMNDFKGIQQKIQILINSDHGLK